MYSNYKPQPDKRSL